MRQHSNKLKCLEGVVINCRSTQNILIYSLKNLKWQNENKMIFLTKVWLYDGMSDEEIQYHHGTVWLKFLADQEIFYLGMLYTIRVTCWFTTGIKPKSNEMLSPSQWGSSRTLVLLHLQCEAGNWEAAPSRTQTDTQEKLLRRLRRCSYREKSVGRELKNQHSRASFK